MSRRPALTAVLLITAGGGVFGVAIAMLPPEKEIASTEALAFVIAAALTIRFKWFPIAACWILTACVSTVQLTNARISIGSFPVGIVDVLALLLGLGWMCRVAHRSIRRGTAPTSMPAGWVSLAAYAILGVGLGYIHGYSWYPIVIDVRTVLYLFIGYGGGTHLMEAKHEAHTITMLLWMTLGGFILAQAIASTSSFQGFQTTGGSLENYRDIGSPVFAGKYGLFLAAVLVMERHLRSSWRAAGLLAAGVAAVAVSLVRTGWVSVAVGFLLLLFAAKGKGVARLGTVVAWSGVPVILVLMTVPQASTFLGALQHRAQELVQPQSADSDTVASRLNESQTALSSLQNVVDWTVGVGLGYVPPGDINPFQHNSIVWLLSKLGLIGLALFLTVVIVLPFTKAWTHLRTLEGQRRQLLLVLVAAQAANVAAGYASGSLTYWPYMAVIGMTTAWIDQLARCKAGPDALDKDSPSATSHSITQGSNSWRLSR